MLLIFSILVVAGLIAFWIIKKEKSAKQTIPTEETPLGYETNQPVVEVKLQPKKRGPKPKTATMKAKAPNKTKKKSK